MDTTRERSVWDDIWDGLTRLWREAADLVTVSLIALLLIASVA